jgi:ribosomal protein L7/L12
LTDTFHCPACGGPLEIPQGAETALPCPYCHNTVILPNELRSRPQLGGQAPIDDRIKPERPDAAAVMPQQVEAEIRELLATRQKITAIKVYRQGTGASLKDAKEAVEAIEAGGSIDASKFQPQYPAFSSLVDDGATLGLAVQLIQQGDKIGAIRLLRNRYDVSLKVAKDAADLMETGQEVDMAWLKMKASQAASPAVHLPAENHGRSGINYLAIGCILGVLLVIFIALMIAIR